MGGVLLTAAAVRLGWRPGVTVAPAPDGSVVSVADRRRAVRVGCEEPWRAALLEALAAAGGTPLEGIVAAVAQDGGPPTAAIEARTLLHGLARRGLLSARLVDEQGVAADIATPQLPDEPAPAPGLLVVSADVLLRRAAAPADPEPGLVLESAADPARRDLVTPRFAAALLAGEVPPAWAAVLVHAGVLQADTPADPLEPAARWEFHDRLFHTRSRMWDGAAREYGATGRLASAMAALPAAAVPAGATGAPIPLAPPAPAGPDAAVAFADVAERRRSRRRPGGPLRAQQLGDLLHRVARVRGVRPSAAGDEVDRPVPSGGALATVGVYPLVVDVDGLAPGLYHYDGAEHALRAFEAAPAGDLERLVAGARQTAGLAPDAPVQALLLLAARFGRLQRKYSAMAYAVALKDAGVILQALSLTATAIGAGACALGGGDALAFARASGLDPWDEGTVAELLLAGGEDDDR